MRVAFVDIQGFAVDGWFVPKELTIEIGFKRSHYIFLPPKPFNALSNDDKKTASYVEKKLLGIRYSDGAVELSKINEILETKLLYAADYIYVRGEQKAEFLSKKCHIFGVFPLIIDVRKFNGTPLATGNVGLATNPCHAVGLFSCTERNVDRLRHWFSYTILPL
uniref:Uncharacterized protein LOC114344791 isoform X1 n=1 Tax=Diabrotica virgifera virgifera TaxID=50390 RepID=A0A6P7GNE8_DIAVI